MFIRSKIECSIVIPVSHNKKFQMIDFMKLIEQCSTSLYRLDRDIDFIMLIKNIEQILNI